MLSLLLLQKARQVFHNHYPVFPWVSLLLKLSQENAGSLSVGVATFRIDKDLTDN